MKIRFSAHFMVALVIVAPFLAACVSLPAATTAPPAATAAPAVGMANPASVYCGKQGGELKIEQDAQGGQHGQCIFPDGSQCEEWAFFRGECKPGQPPATLTPPPAVPLTEQALRNARYELPGLGAVELKEGKFEKKYGDGATQVNTAGYLTAAFGDLDQDGAEDAAAVLWWSGGGSGTFVYLVALRNDAGTPRQVAVVSLGDRTNVDTVTIRQNQVMVSMRERGASTAVEKRFILQGTALNAVTVN